MSRTIPMGAAIVLLLAGILGCSNQTATMRTAAATSSVAEHEPEVGSTQSADTSVIGARATGSDTVEPEASRASTEPHVAVLETALGNIVIELHEKDAPKTVANFEKLVREKFYDGTYFHRVIPGFMIQGGDPNSKNEDPNDDGMGGPGYTVPAEIKLPHLRGSVATARLGDQTNPERASSGSQFFIDVAPQPGLDRGGYTVFGRVISGMDAVDKIVELAKDPSTPQGAGGPNPGKKALVRRAYLEPASKWSKSAQAGDE